MDKMTEESMMETPERIVIDETTGTKLVDWKELRQYRDLFYFLVRRDIKTRYAQSVLGVGWAVIQPVFSMIVFSVVFGRFAGVSSDGVPYPIFSFAALVPWTYFSNSLSTATSSLISSSNMISKVYFPRLVIPLAPVIGKLVDFTIAMGLLFVMMAWYRMTPTIGTLTLPLLIILMMVTATGMGLWLTTLAVQYRDVNYAMTFIIQLMMYASPVVYPASSVPEELRYIYAINPMAGVIEGFRSALLGTHPMPWDMIAIGSISAVIITFTGLWYFRRTERYFADVV